MKNLTRIRRITWAIVVISCAAFWGGLIHIATAQTFGNPQASVLAYAYNNITTDATTQVKSNPGLLHTICINTPAATETITIYDSLTGSGTKIGTVTLTAASNGCITYDVNFRIGLTIVTAVAAGDITVAYY